MGYNQYTKRVMGFLNLVAGQGVAKTESNFSMGRENGTGLAMVFGKDIG
jgi:hypothetical protein